MNTNALYSVDSLVSDFSSFNIGAPRGGSRPAEEHKRLIEAFASTSMFHDIDESWKKSAALFFTITVPEIEEFFSLLMLGHFDRGILGQLQQELHRLQEMHVAGERTYLSAVLNKSEIVTEIQEFVSWDDNALLVGFAIWITMLIVTLPRLPAAAQNGQRDALVAILKKYFDTILVQNFVENYIVLYAGSKQDPCLQSIETLLQEIAVAYSLASLYRYADELLSNKDAYPEDSIAALEKFLQLRLQLTPEHELQDVIAIVKLLYSRYDGHALFAKVASLEVDDKKKVALREALYSTISLETVQNLIRESDRGRVGSPAVIREAECAVFIAFGGTRGLQRVQVLQRALYNNCEGLKTAHLFCWFTAKDVTLLSRNERSRKVECVMATCSEIHAEMIAKKSRSLQQHLQEGKTAKLILEYTGDLQLSKRDVFYGALYTLIRAHLTIQNRSQNDNNELHQLFALLEGSIQTEVPPLRVRFLHTFLQFGKERGAFGVEMHKFARAAINRTPMQFFCGRLAKILSDGEGYSRQEAEELSYVFAEKSAYSAEELIPTLRYFESMVRCVEGAAVRDTQMSLLFVSITRLAKCIIRNPQEVPNKEELLSKVQTLLVRIAVRGSRELYEAQQRRCIQESLIQGRVGNFFKSLVARLHFVRPFPFVERGLAVWIPSADKRVVKDLSSSSEEFCRSIEERGKISDYRGCVGILDRILAMSYAGAKHNNNHPFTEQLNHMAALLERCSKDLPLIELLKLFSAMPHNHPEYNHRPFVIKENFAVIINAITARVSFDTLVAGLKELVPLQFDAMHAPVLVQMVVQQMKVLCDTVRVALQRDAKIQQLLRDAFLPVVRANSALFKEVYKTYLDAAIEQSPVDGEQASQLRALRWTMQELT